jgi:hypothetical protein
MTIQNLIKAFPPPVKPAYPFDGPWEPIEARIRTPLPQDYKDLVRLYGCGKFMDTVQVFSPAYPSDYCQLLPQVFQMQRDFVAGQPEIPMYPIPGGLLVCGNVVDTGYIFWLTRGPVSEWPIVLWDHDPIGPELETFECDLTDFLAGVVTGGIWPKAFGDYGDYRAKVFQSASDLPPSERETD